MTDPVKQLSEVEALLEDKKEALFLCQQDLEVSRTENIALKNFIQTLYESCQHLENSELTLDSVIKNLSENIRVFARDHHINL